MKKGHNNRIKNNNNNKNSDHTDNARHIYLNRLSRVCLSLFKQKNATSCVLRRPKKYKELSRYGKFCRNIDFS